MFSRWTRGATKYCLSTGFCSNLCGRVPLEEARLGVPCPRGAGGPTSGGFRTPWKSCLHVGSGPPWPRLLIIHLIALHVPFHGSGERHLLHYLPHRTLGGQKKPALKYLERSNGNIRIRPFSVPGSGIRASALTTWADAEMKYSSRDSAALIPWSDFRAPVLSHDAPHPQALGSVHTCVSSSRKAPKEMVPAWPAPARCFLSPASRMFSAVQRGLVGEAADFSLWAWEAPHFTPFTS